MTLSEIAEGIEVVDEQRDRGVAAVDETGEDLADALAEYAEDLPCSAEEAATLVEAYAGGAAVGAAGHEAGVVPVAAAKTLHLLGMEGVCPLSPIGREVVRDWAAGRISHAEARELADADETEFALAHFIETHEPLAGADEVLERALADGTDASVAKREELAGTMSDVDDLL